MEKKELSEKCDDLKDKLEKSTIKVDLPSPALLSPTRDNTMRATSPEKTSSPVEDKKINDMKAAFQSRKLSGLEKQVRDLSRQNSWNAVQFRLEVSAAKSQHENENRSLKKQLSLQQVLTPQYKLLLKMKRQLKQLRSETEDIKKECLTTVTDIVKDIKDTKNTLQSYEEIMLPRIDFMQSPSADPGPSPQLTISTPTGKSTHLEVPRLDFSSPHQQQPTTSTTNTAPSDTAVPVISIAGSTNSHDEQLSFETTPEKKHFAVPRITTTSPDSFHSSSTLFSPFSHLSAEFNADGGKVMSDEKVNYWAANWWFTTFQSAHAELVADALYIYNTPQDFKNGKASLSKKIKIFVLYEKRGLVEFKSAKIDKESIFVQPQPERYYEWKEKLMKATTPPPSSMIRAPSFEAAIPSPRLQQQL